MKLWDRVRSSTLLLEEDIKYPQISAYYTTGYEPSYMSLTISSNINHILLEPTCNKSDFTWLELLNLQKTIIFGIYFYNLLQIKVLRRIISKLMDDGD